MGNTENSRRTWTRSKSANFILLLLFLLDGTLVNSTNRRISSMFSEYLVNPNQTYNHRPIFSNCTTYSSVIKEDIQPGTEIIQVKAYDEDPPENGGTISYSFNKKDEEVFKFEIDSTTGVIRTNGFFNRDEPDREEMVYLSVVATDNGKPQFRDFCSFKVTIEDVNDNSPVFDKTFYNVSIPVDAQLNYEIMRIFAEDLDDGNNSLIKYFIPTTTSDHEYQNFDIDEDTGVIYLKRKIDKKAGDKLHVEVIASDMGINRRMSSVMIEVKVDLIKKAPSFISVPDGPIRIPENFSDFTTPIFELKATSNIENSFDLYFILNDGATDRRNKDKMFKLQFVKDTAFVKLAMPLDYEYTTRYTLRVNVMNEDFMEAETKIDIEVLDVNDNVPYFLETDRISVLENEPRGTLVARVQTIDADITSTYNKVTYKLGNYKNLFIIDPITGDIRTLKSFDREEVDSFNLKVIAIDSSPSALFNNGTHNEKEQLFRINIADKNDNPPLFPKSIYIIPFLAENTSVDTYVAEVTAVDRDPESSLVYNITSGNTDNSFYIERYTGIIRVNGPLDYEKIKTYDLILKVYDGSFMDATFVMISIENLNDNPPVFGDFNANVQVKEEELVKDCITTVVAWDPDIEEREGPQYIKYFIATEEQNLFMSIDNHGCLKLKKPLDREPPHGRPEWTITVGAIDENDSSGSLVNYTTVNITLIDVNDNSPFLDMSDPIWNKRNEPGLITELKAGDLDSENNGPPFTFTIDLSADSEIKSKFYINGSSLYGNVTFDREERESYAIPISITDSGKPPMTGTTMLKVNLVDVDDNATNYDLIII